MPSLELEEYELSEERVITATRFEQKVVEAPAIVQIFSAKRFRELGIETVADALRLLAGVYVRPWRTSQWTAIFRGTLSTDNNKFLLLVDGVPWRDAVYGWAWIDRYLTLANVRQIEVIRGPGSAMYGSNAFAGVINIITRRGEHLRGTQAGAMVGSFWRQELWANAGDVLDTPLGRADVAAYARYFDENGDGPPFSTKDVRRIGAKDPHTGVSGGFRVGLAGLSLKWDTVSHAHARMDGAVNTFRDIVTQNPSLFNYNYLNNFLDLRYDLDLPWRFRLQPRLLFQHYQNTGSYVKCVGAGRIQGIVPEAPLLEGSCTPDPKSGELQLETVVEPVKETRRLGAGLELQHDWEQRNHLVLGFEWESEQIREVEDVAYVGGTYIPGLEGYRIPHTPLSIDDLALYAQDTVRPFAGLGLGLTLGARLGSHRIPRYDEQRKEFDIQTFDHFSPRAGLVYSFDRQDRWVIKLLYGQAFRAPTARELLLESSGEWTSGDPTLEPEEIRTYEAELTLRPWRWLSLVTTGYANFVDDEIVEQDERYARSKGFRVYGVDSELRLQLKTLEAMVNFSYIDALDRSADLAQYGVPTYQGNWTLTYRPGQQLSASLVGHYVGQRPRRDWRQGEYWAQNRDQQEDGEPYTLLDLQLRAEELLGGTMALTFSVHNLLGTPVHFMLEKDRSRSHLVDYEMESRAFMVRLDARL
ncbi:MAG: hypothetical protein FJ125_03415 [Deltaproteobacteria bacterium]|nr:hypothetical protein [Deltaproteobacteria bacterium]